LIWVEAVPSAGVTLGAISVGGGGSGVSVGGGVNDGGNVTVTMNGVEVAPLPSWTFTLQLAVNRMSARRMAFIFEITDQLYC